MEARLIFMALVCLCIAQLAFAAEDNYPFNTDQQQQRFVNLTKQIRCATCKTQTLFDSNTKAAAEMRSQIYNLLNSGKSDQQIREYFADHYGSAMLLLPPWRMNTIILWLGPLLMLGLALLAFRSFLGREPKFKWR